MANRNQKWSLELRKVMYARLVCEFGPYATWGKVAYPDGRKERFEKVLKELAAYFVQQSGDSFEWTALHQQMKWGVTKQGTVKNAGFAYQYILNKAAALETGFITSAELAGFSHLQEIEAESEEITMKPSNASKFAWSDGDLSDIHIPDEEPEIR